MFDKTTTIGTVNPVHPLGEILKDPWGILLADNQHDNVDEVLIGRVSFVSDEAGLSRYLNRQAFVAVFDPQKLEDESIEYHDLQASCLINHQHCVSSAKSRSLKVFWRDDGEKLACRLVSVLVNQALQEFETMSIHELEAFVPYSTEGPLVTIDCIEPGGQVGSLILTSQQMEGMQSDKSQIEFKFGMLTAAQQKMIPNLAKKVVLNSCELEDNGRALCEALCGQTEHILQELVLVGRIPFGDVEMYYLVGNSPLASSSRLVIKSGALADFLNETAAKRSTMDFQQRIASEMLCSSNSRRPCCGHLVLDTRGMVVDQTSPPEIHNLNAFVSDALSQLISSSDKSELLMHRLKDMLQKRPSLPFTLRGITTDSLYEFLQRHFENGSVGSFQTTLAVLPSCETKVQSASTAARSPLVDPASLSYFSPIYSPFGGSPLSTKNTGDQLSENFETIFQSPDINHDFASPGVSEVGVLNKENNGAMSAAVADGLNKESLDSFQFLGDLSISDSELEKDIVPFMAGLDLGGAGADVVESDLEEPKQTIRHGKSAGHLKTLKAVHEEENEEYGHRAHRSVNRLTPFRATATADRSSLEFEQTPRRITRSMTPNRFTHSMTKKL